MDPVPTQSRRSEVTMLRVVVVCMVVLYIVLAGYLIYSNQNIGSTQLGYSSLLANQSGQLQDAVTQLLTSVNEIQQDNLGRAALVNSRLKQLEAQSQLIAKALETAGKTHAQTAQNQTGDLAKLRDQLTALRNELTTLETADQRAAAVLQAELKQLQTALTQNVTALTAQRDQLLTNVRSDLATLREELGRTSKSLAGQSQTTWLAQLADDTAARARGFSQINHTNLAEARRAWQQARWVAGETAAVPALAPKSQELAALTVDLGQKIAVVVTTEVARYERLATETKDPAAARDAWTKAGQWLFWFPVSDDPAALDRLRELTLAHEAVRQKLPAAPK